MMQQLSSSLDETKNDVHAPIERYNEQPTSFVFRNSKTADAESKLAAYEKPESSRQLIDTGKIKRAWSPGSTSAWGKRNRFSDDIENLKRQWNPSSSGAWGKRDSDGVDDDDDDRLISLNLDNVRELTTKGEAANRIQDFSNGDGEFSYKRSWNPSSGGAWGKRGNYFPASDDKKRNWNPTASGAWGKRNRQNSLESFLKRQWSPKSAAAWGKRKRRSLRFTYAGEKSPYSNSIASALKLLRENGSNRDVDCVGMGTSDYQRCMAQNQLENSRHSITPSYQYLTERPDSSHDNEDGRSGSQYSLLLKKLDFNLDGREKWRQKLLRAWGKK